MRDQSTLLTQFVTIGAQVALGLVLLRLAAAAVLAGAARVARCVGSRRLSVRLAAAAIRVSPALVRGALCIALGSGAVIGSGVAGAVPYASAAPPATGAMRPAPPAVVPVLDRVLTPGHPARHHSPAPAGSRYLVRDGDSLWSIAASALGPGADDVAIARQWPRWFAANRAAIGADPAVLRVGERLHVPAPATTPRTGEAR